MREEMVYEPIVLSPSPKTPGTPDRCISLERTLSNLPLLREKYGITRVGDTTWLDRTGIPTMCAIVPNSPDLLSVYNGKGLTRDVATASAVMEAVERQIAAAPRLPVMRMRVRDACELIDLRACGLLEEAIDLETDFVWGTDLLTSEAVPVPLASVQCPWFGERLFKTISSNGLASGNTMVEAIYHALTELIERHIWSLFYVRSQLVPRFFLGAGSADLALAQEVKLPTGHKEIDALTDAVLNSNMGLRVLHLEEPPLPIMMLASLVEHQADPPMAHTGLGCSLSPVHALERAITECVQSRVVDIQAAREDILRADEPAGIMGGHARRQMSLPKGRWYFDLPTSSVNLDSIEDRMDARDLANDVATLVESLRRYGCSRVITVDLSPPDVPVSVVRAIVPELETTTIDGRIGPFARREFNPFYVRTAL